MPEYEQFTPEPWEQWNLKPHVPDNRSTPDLITELIQTLPASGTATSQVPCAYTKVGRHKKKTRCWNRAVEGTNLCRQHLNHMNR